MKDLLACRAIEGVQLELGILILGADPGVADDHQTYLVCTLITLRLLSHRGNDFRPKRARSRGRTSNDRLLIVIPPRTLCSRAGNISEHGQRNLRSLSLNLNLGQAVLRLDALHSTVSTTADEHSDFVALATGIGDASRSHSRLALTGEKAMTTCVRHLVIQSRQYGQMTVYPEDGYRRFRVTWFFGGRLHSPSMNKATLLAFIERIQSNGGTVSEEFDWGYDPSELDED